MRVVHLLLLLCVAVMLLTIFHQGNTITEQRTMIRQMMRNPNCMEAK
jgi:hypothetical protein